MLQINLNKKNLGFSLIELMVVVAIIGILASMSASVYSDYITRTRVSEALVIFEKLKNMSLDYYNVNGSMPSGFTDIAGSGATLTTTSFIPATHRYMNLLTITKDNGNITFKITFKAAANISVTNNTTTNNQGVSTTTASTPSLEFVSDISQAGTSGIITWKCQSSTILKNNLPGSCEKI